MPFTNLFIKFIIITASLLSGILYSANPALVIVFMLTFLLNMQIRRYFTKDAVIFASLILDLVIIYYTYNMFSHQTYLLILVTTLDTINHAQKYKWGLLAMCGSLLIILSINATIENIIYIFLLFITFVYFASEQYKKAQIIKEIEYLFDDQRRTGYELEKARNTAEAYSLKIEEMAQVQERNRISIEIHDTVGHRLTALLMQFEAGVRLTENGDSKGIAFLKDSLQYLRETIDVLRNTVRKMKPKDYTDLVKSLKEFAIEFQNRTAVNIEVTQVGEQYRLLPSVAITLYQNAFEAVTNSVRHGKADNIQIIIDFTSENILMTVADNGLGCAEIKKGLGLRNMEERLQILGGMLVIDNSSGFSVKSLIPVKGVVIK